MSGANKTDNPPALKSCLFCGGTKLATVTDTRIAGWRIACKTTGCQAQGPVRETTLRAMLAWNNPLSAHDKTLDPSQQRRAQ